mgnify:CR=1 FL=1
MSLGDDAIRRLKGANLYVIAGPSGEILAGNVAGLQAGVLNGTLGKDPLPSLVVTFGLSIVIQNALLQVFSADPRAIDTGGLNTVGFSGGTLGFSANTGADVVITQGATQSNHARQTVAAAAGQVRYFEEGGRHEASS